MSRSPHLVQRQALSQQGFPNGVPSWYGPQTDVSYRRPVPLQDQYWKRFLDIYHKVCDNSWAPHPKLILRTEQSPSASDKEAALADELFVQELGRTTRPKSIWRSQKTSDGKDYTTATAALLRLVQEGGTPGVAQCLVRKGGTILLSKHPQKQVEKISERHALLVLATSLGRVSLVNYLATISPPERIAEALAISVRSDNVELTRVLLQTGASPDSLFQSVPEHFNLLSSAMLEVLLQSPTEPSTSTRNRWITSAVADAKLDLAILLLRYGASPGLDYLEILRKAIEELHLQAFLVALKCMHSSGAMHFNGLLRQLVTCSNMAFADKMLATEAILCVANSKEARAFRQRLRVGFLLDQDASKALDICAGSAQIALAELFRQPRFDTKVLAKTLLSAINTCDFHLLNHLYPHGSPSILPEGFSLDVLPAVEDHTTRERLLLRLLDLKVQGTYLDEELVLAVQNQDGVMVKLLLNAGASVNYNTGKALLLAVEAQNVPFVQALLPHCSQAVRSTVFPRLQATEKLPRRLMTKLFVEAGVSENVLHVSLRDALCDYVALRDDTLIDILINAGADCRLVEAPSVLGLVEQGEVESINALFMRMVVSEASNRTLPAMVSQLMNHAMQYSKGSHTGRAWLEMAKLFVQYGATGESVLSAFEVFLGSKVAADEDTLTLFLRPLPGNRTAAYNALMVRVLNSMDSMLLHRLIHKIELYDEVLQLLLENAACEALNDDAGIADRVRCYLAHVESKNPVIEKSLDFHMRTYGKRCEPRKEWPMQTISALSSKGFVGTVWLTHALMAIAEADNAEVLSAVLNSAQQACTQDLTDSVLMVAAQHKPACNLRTLETLLAFGPSQDGLDMALLIASETNDVPASAILLKNGADINYRSGACLTTALRADGWSTLKCLLASKMANQSSLAAVWTLLTESPCDLPVARKIQYCRMLLQANFFGAQVQEFLLRNISSENMDYEATTMILDESKTLNHNTSEILHSSLACAVESANGRACRLVLTYLPAEFDISVNVLKTATTTSTAILALLLDHIPHAKRQETLNICLLHAASFAADCGTCTYLLYEGASCDTMGYGAISVATERALKRNGSDRAPLEALLASRPGREALKSAWHIAVASLRTRHETDSQDFHLLRTIKILQLVLSAGLQDLAAVTACVSSLCDQPRAQVSKCENSARNTNMPNVSDCCPFKRIQAKTGLLVESLLHVGLAADYDNGRSIVAATRNLQHEMLEMLLATVQHIATNASKWFFDRNDCEIFFRHSSQSTEQKQARLKTIDVLLKHGAMFPALGEALVAAVHSSVTNTEARETAELLLKFNVCDTSESVLPFLAEHPQPPNRTLLSLALEQESSKCLRLQAVEKLLTSGLDEDSIIDLVLSALYGSTSQVIEMTIDETHKLLRVTAEAGMSQVLTMLLSCIPKKSAMSPFYASPSFVAWLLQSDTEVNVCFLTAVLEWLEPDEVRKIDDSSDGLCLIQEAIRKKKFHLVPLLVSSGAATITKTGSSLLYYTLEHTNGETPQLLAAVLSLCNDSTLDDGSLQLAVLTMREEVVHLLLEQGHDPNFGIQLEASSTERAFPVNMLCATASVVAHESDCGIAFKRIMSNLMIHGANIREKMYGRSALFNALDNPRCTVGLLRNVVDCFHLSDELEQMTSKRVSGTTCSSTSKVDGDDDTQSFQTAASTPLMSGESAQTSFFEFEDSKHHYSASMYLKKDVPCPPYLEQPQFSARKKTALLKFLRIQDLPDIFYALEGPQPADAIGVPIELLLGSAGCAVCGESVTHITDAFGNLTGTCTHDWTVFMCKECLDGYITSKITVENGAVNNNVSCWAEGCSEMLSHYEIKKYAEPELFELYDHALLQQIIHEGETFAECSTQNCKGGGWLESEDVSYFECHLCHQETCVSHNGPRKDHAGKPCPATAEGQRYAEEEAREEAERQAAIVAKNKVEKEAKKKAKAEADRLAKERKEGLKATEALMKKISKNCPSCKVPIEKSVGCDHMTCRSGSGRAGCGAEFCWECLVPYTAIRAEGNGAHNPDCPHFRRNTYLH